MPIIIPDEPYSVVEIDSSISPEIHEIKIVNEGDYQLIVQSIPLIKIVEKYCYASCWDYEIQDENGDHDKKYHYNAFVNYACGNICASLPETDYWFENNQVIGYKRHEMATENPGKNMHIRFTSQD